VSLLFPCLSVVRLDDVSAMDGRIVLDGSPCVSSAFCTLCGGARRWCTAVAGARSWTFPLRAGKR